MGACTSKPPKPNPYASREDLRPSQNPLSPSPLNQNVPCKKDEFDLEKRSPFIPFYSPSPARFLFGKDSPNLTNRSADSTPRRFLKRPFPPPSPAKHIKAVLARRQGKKADSTTARPEEEGGDGLDKRFGFPKSFAVKYELGEEIGKGHFGYTCSAKAKKGDLKGQQVAVKVIPKRKMTTTIAIEDVRREVKILQALAGHSNLVHFYGAYEDHDNVYIVME